MPEDTVHELEHQISSALSLSDLKEHWIFLASCKAGFCCLPVSLLEDKTASIWPIFFSDEIPIQRLLTTFQELLKKAEQLAIQSHSQILQVLIDFNDYSRIEILEGLEIPFITDLYFYRLTEDEIQEHIKPVEELNYMLIDTQTLFAEAVEILDLSYVNSLDCPEVLTGKSGQDVLQSYFKSGDEKHQPEIHALLMFAGKKPLGILIFKEYYQEIRVVKKLWELSYIGLPVPHRHQGWGEKMLLKGLTYVKERGGEEIVVAVDRRNFPAIKMYEKIGFEFFHEQKLFAKILKKNQC